MNPEAPNEEPFSTLHFTVTSLGNVMGSRKDIVEECVCERWRNRRSDFLTHLMIVKLRCLYLTHLMSVELRRLYLTH